MYKKKIFYIIKFLFFLFCNISFANEKIFINAKTLQYKDVNKVVIANGDAIVKDQKGNLLTSDKIIYDKIKSTISSFENSKFSDKENIITANQFIYYLDKKIIIAKDDVKLIDKEKNIFYFKNIKYYLELKKIEFSYVNAELANKSFFSSKKGSIDQIKGKTFIENTNYTTCLVNNLTKEGKCPSWSLESKKILHDKNSELIKHYGTILKIKNIPVLYSPYISHPDPSVKRKSGLLYPVFKSNSELGRSVKIPYFFAINEDKDFTFSPTLFLNEHHLYSGSYRQAFKNGKLITDFGYTQGYKRFENSSRTQGSRNYIFAQFNGAFKNILFNDNLINFSLRRVSQPNFLRVYKINNILLDVNEGTRNLTNQFEIISYDPKKIFNFKLGIIENLNSEDKNKYSYLFPDGYFSFNNKFFGNNFNFKTNYTAKKFENNQKQAKILNQINVISSPQIYNKIGLSNIFKANLLNNNIYNNNVNGEKQHDSINNYLTLAFDTSMPFAKVKKYSTSILTPKIFIKHTTGKNENSKNDNKIMDYSDIFLMNRTNNLSKPETGFSQAYGVDYSFKLKNLKNEPFLKSDFSIGQIFSNNKRDNLPISSSLNNKSSDLIGSYSLKFIGDKIEKYYEKNKNNNSLINFQNNYFDIKYKFNANSNLSKFYRNEIEIGSTYKFLNTNIRFNENREHIGQIRDMYTKITTLFSVNYSLFFESKKNLLTQNSEFQNLGLKYENDCIITSLFYGKNFYTDKDLPPTKSINFNIIFKPFSVNIAPDISGLIK